MTHRISRRTALTAAGGSALGLALAGCNLGPATIPGEGGAAATGPTLTFRVADNWNPTHPSAAAIDEIFKPRVERNSGRTLTAEVYHSGTLGNEAELWDGVRNGTIDMAVIGTVMNQEFPVMLISDWPFLYTDVKHAKDVWTGRIATDISARFHEQFPTTEILGWAPNSARTFTSSKPLTSVADFAGQKFRMPANPIHLGIANNLGASAQVIPLGELFSALETGVVDGQDNGMVTVRSEGLYEVQSHIYETNHIVATLEIIANTAFLDRLSDDQEAIVREAAEESARWAWDAYLESIDADRTFLSDEGLTITELTPQARQEMIDRLQPLLDQLYAENAWAPELVERIQADG